MATIAAVIRWADNTADLARNLKEGMNQIEATRASVEKLVQSFQGEKLVQAAHRNVAAIKEVGGAFILSEAQAKRSLGIITDAMATLERQQKPIPEAMRAMKTELEGVIPATTSWADKLQLVYRAFQALVALQVVRWMKEGITAAFDYADTLTNLSSRLKINVEGLQRLESIGVSAGVSLDSMARAASALYKNLDSAAGKKALRDMGMNFDEIRQMQPERMFVEVGRAVQGIADPIDQANKKTALFGRTFDEVAASFDQDVDTIVNGATIISAEQIAATDKMGDAWDQFYLNQSRSLKAWMGELVTAGQTVGWLRLLTPTLAMNALAESKFRQGMDTGPLPKLPGAPSLMGAGLQTIGDESHARFLREIEEAIDKQAQAAKRAAEEQARWNERVREFSGHIIGTFVGDLTLLKFQLSHVADATLIADQMAIGYLGTLKQFTDTQIPEHPSRMIGDGMGTNPTAIPSKTFEDADEAVTKTEKLLGYLSDVDQILSGINAKWAQMASVAVRAVGGVVEKLAKGDWIGAIVAGVAGLGGLIAGLFNNEEIMAINDLRDGFYEAAGGAETLNPRIQTLTGNLRLMDAILAADTMEEYEAAIQAVNDVLKANERAILDAADAYGEIQDKLRAVTVMTPGLQAALDKAFAAKNADDYLAALQDINRELDEQESRYNDIVGVLQKYGLEVSDVTDKVFLQQNINKRALDLRKDYDLLRQSGVDMNKVMGEMGPIVNAFVQDAIKMGIEVPEAMREVIQVAIDTGAIFDANGKKVENIEDLGLKFGLTMQETMATVGTAIDRLNTILEAMAKFFGVVLPNAAQKGADAIQDALDSIEVPDLVPDGILNPDIRNDTGRDGGGVDHGFLGVLVTEQGIQRFASGGRVLNFVPRGIDTVPAMLAVGEGVVNHTGMRTLGDEGLRDLNNGKSASGGSVIVNFHNGAIQAGHVVTEHDLKKVITQSVLEGIEGGGREFGKFSKLVKQAS